MFDLCVGSGYGRFKIANFLSEMGIKTRDGKNWHEATVGHILHNIMYTDLITASPDETEDDVAADVFKYYLPAMPVVDERGKLLGIVTTDDAWDAIEDDVSGDKTKKSVLLGLGATAAAVLFLVLYTLVLFQIIGYSWR